MENETRVLKRGKKNREENETRVPKRRKKNREEIAATNRTPRLPNDVFRNLFTMLPAKSLMRFKSVCKSWRDMISDPFSVQSRFHSHPSYLPDESHIFFFANFDEKSTGSIIPTNLQGELSTKIPNHVFSKNLIPCTEIVNGLVCLLDKENFQLYMFNVYTGEKMPLPSIPKTQHGNSSSLAWRELFTMGFDPLTREHKVLLFYIDDKNYFQKGKILTFGSNTWRDVNFSPLKRKPSVLDLPFKRSMICVDGTIYWVRRDTRDKKEIECFHVGKESLEHFCQLQYISQIFT